MRAFSFLNFRCYTTPNRLKTRPHFNSNSSSSSGSNDLSRRIFVSNLSLSTDWKHLKDYFASVGPVAYASVSKDMVTQQSKGCGLVQFEKADDVDKAIQLLNGQLLGGSVIHVREDRQEKKEKKVEEGRSEVKKEGKIFGTERRRESFPRREEVEDIGRSRKQQREGREELERREEKDEKEEKKKKKLIPEEQRPSFRVFVSGLPLNYDWMELKDYFKAVGPVRYCDIYTHQGSGKSRGTAVVEFERKSDVSKAIEFLNGAILEPEKMMIRVEPYERYPSSSNEASQTASSSSSRSSSSSSSFSRLATLSTIDPLVPVLRQTPLPEEMKNSLAVFADSRVFVNHLPRDLDWKIVKDTFAVIGPVAHVEILTDPHTGKSRGCGFIKFRTVSDAKKAIEVLHHSIIEGKMIEVGEYQEERDNRRDRNWRRNTLMKIRLPSERERE
jgi:RNA-binding protein 23/39